MAEHTFNFVTPEELEKRLEGYDDNFLKLRDLDKHYREMRDQLDQVAAQLQADNTYSAQLEQVLQIIAERRRSYSDVRFEVATDRARQGIAPSDEQIEDLFRRFQERFNFTEDVTGKLEELGVIIEETRGTANSALDLSTRTWEWIKFHLGVGDDVNGPNRLDDIENRLHTVTGQVSDLDRRVRDLEKQNSFSFTPIIALALILGAVGAFIGMFTAHWVIAMVIGAFIGALAGLILSGRSKKVKPVKRVQTNPNPNSNSIPRNQ